jgi:hypothetical protein
MIFATGSLQRKLPGMKRLTTQYKVFISRFAPVVSSEMK